MAIDLFISPLGLSVKKIFKVSSKFFLDREPSAKEEQERQENYRDRLKTNRPAWTNG
jgi:hypothetical protein